MNLAPRTRFWLAALAGTILLALLAIVLSNDKAKAQEVYFGVHAGKSMASTDITNTAGTFSLDGLGSNGYVGGIHGGIDVKMPSSAVFVGTFVGYDWQNTAFNITAGSSNFNIALHDSWYVGARAGVLVHGAKVYVLSAYRQTEATTSVSTLTIANPKGFDLGVGIDVPLAKNITLGIEGIRTQYQKDEFMFGTPAAPTGIHAETDQMSVMVRLNTQLGSLGSTPSIFTNESDPPAPKQRSPK